MPILYIGGYGRSGSTVLDQNIAMNLCGISLGEAVYLPRSVQRNDACSCGLQPSACPVWHEAVSQLQLQQPSLKAHSFREDGLFGLVSSPSQRYVQVQRSVFRDLGSTLYCDSSKTCRLAMLRPLALERLFPGQLLFVWLKRPLLDTIMQSLIKGTNRQLENGARPGFPLVRIIKGIMGYVYANATAWFYASIVFRGRSILIDQRQLRRHPDIVLNRIAGFVQRSPVACVPSSKYYPLFVASLNQSLGSLHQIAGNRNRL